MKKSALALVAIAATGLAGSVPLAAQTPQSPTFQVTVAGLRTVEGQLIICLWKDKAGFPNCEKSQSAVRKVVSVKAGTMTIALPLPVPGNYAITVVHDEDGNGRTKHNFIGMPVEGVGISNNPGGMPGFDKSLVNLAPGNTVTIRMKYLFG
ncbi:hypothetical protein MB02_12145 [Croceicoccus estronivorus]|uniref:DUF2141 domain-containing protein n=1 Tax=Croceicoccus estronivorus TaxID=1172626 RepID=UPI000831B1B2|nr:DUF2141 domain-containing protein [Croceicoccus estronivorus]OCC23478.1 hypothetical protein MB02_12145 [Croceicoccus estronivorus]